MPGFLELSFSRPQFLSPLNLGGLSLPSGGRFPVRLSSSTLAVLAELRSIRPGNLGDSQSGSKISYLPPKRRSTKIDNLPPAA